MKDHGEQGRRSIITNQADQVQPEMAIVDQVAGTGNIDKAFEYQQGRQWIDKRVSMILL